MPNPNARISRVANSWRVRVYGFNPWFFADIDYGGKAGALAAAREWRDQYWDGKDLHKKLTEIEVRRIQESKESPRVLAEKYGISADWVYKLRRKAE